MAAKGRSIALVIVGLGLVLFGFAADVIGVGAHPGIGWKQIALVVVGVACAVFGLVGLRPKNP
jgi:hypothetical protein